MPTRTLPEPAHVTAPVPVKPDAARARRAVASEPRLRSSLTRYRRLGRMLRRLSARFSLEMPFHRFRGKAVVCRRTRLPNPVHHRPRFQSEEVLAELLRPFQNQ
jgi:hypothetical protein